MSVIKIKTELKQNGKKIIDIEQPAIKEGEKIKTTNDGIIEIMDLKNLILQRKNKEYKTTINFKNKTIKLTYNDYEIPLNIDIKNIKIEQNKIEIKYIVIETKDKFEYKIIWR
jgi:hypothetical protein